MLTYNLCDSLELKKSFVENYLKVRSIENELQYLQRFPDLFNREYNGLFLR